MSNTNKETKLESHTYYAWFSQMPSGEFKRAEGIHKDKRVAESNDHPV